LHVRPFNGNDSWTALVPLPTFSEFVALNEFNVGLMSHSFCSVCSKKNLGPQLAMVMVARVVFDILEEEKSTGAVLPH
jgi:hypothetical protein